MDSSTLILRINEEYNSMLDEMTDKIRQIANVTKAKMYFLAGAYGYYLNEREKLQSNNKDVLRVEYIEKPDYKIQETILNSIYHSQKDKLDEEINKYKLFEEYANAGVKKLYKIFKESENIEDFIETIEIKIDEIIKKLGFSIKEEVENEQV